MAASLLENQLESLHRCLKSTSSLSKEQIVSIIEDIRQLCIHEVTEKDIDLCCSVLFDKDKGLVCFLSRTAANEEFQVSKQRTLELLSEFIQKTGKKIIPYALDIKDVCVSLFSRERLAKVKNAAMPVLVKVIELSAGTSIGKDMGLDKLVNKFFMELTKSASKLTATVKENIYILLGIICEVYPEYMTDYAPRLIGVYITALKAEMTSKTKKPELSIIAGCLEGLTSCLVNFTQSAEEGSKNSYEIFKYARMAIDPDINYTRYDVPRAGLRLFSRHAPQFDIYLVDDYQGMYEKLRYWSKHQNREILHLGTSAIEAFLMQVSETLVERAKEGKKEGAIFKFFIQKFRELMNEKSSSSKELSLAIRGYGLLAAPCRTFLQLTDVQFMFSEMMNKSEQQYLSFDTDMEDKLYNLPSYLEALANIVKELDHVSETYCTSLERLMIVLVDNLPNLHPTMHFVAVRSLIWVMLSVMPKGSTFQQLVNGFVFQSLIRTCSHPPVVETEQIEEESEVDPGARKITYKDYIQMWTTLLNSPAIKEFARHEISIEIRQKLTEGLYDELMKSVLRILHKLDLTSQATTELSEETEQTSSGTIGTSPNDGKTTDPIHGLQPSKPKDFQIFINIVDFCRDLLTNQHAELFERWIFTISHAVIVQSTQKPLVSGFYKMLAISMKIANKLDYFQDLGTLSPVKRDIKMEVDGDKVASNQQRITCFMLMKKFAREVLVRMKQFRDDLLASCLTFILSLPKEIVVEQIEDVVPAIQVTLEIGMSYLPLAMVALDALEYWSQTFPHHVLQKYYCKILPSLDSYLRTADQGSDEVTMDNTLNLSKSKSGRGRKKVPVRLVRGKKEKTDQGFESKLSQVKQRIVRFLGGLGGSINHNLLANTDQDLSKQAIAWDTHQHLRFDMPFIDMKPTIYFDSFLPYVVDLATKSTDRQTKVASCELLHSLVLFCIGRNATLPGPERYSMRPIYSKLFPSMLKLACDVDLVTKQLFEPLLMQLIHWFTNNKKAESEETMSLLDSIYDGIIQPTDTALRDFSAVCLREFLQWSIKQTKNVEKSPINAKSLLKRLYSYALHPGAFKRLGAALAFNNIYTAFREDNALVNLYTFQILVHFVESLAIAHRDEVSLGTLDQCRKSLEHVERIIKVKKDLLKVESKARTEPRAWSGVKLDIAVRWLLRQCGRPQTECRHICMKLVHEFAPLIQGVKSTQNYFQIFYKKSGGEYYISRFEGGGQTSQTKPGIINCPTLTDMVQSFSLQSCQEWFDMLLAPLDCYTWVFGESLLNPQDVFSDDAVDKAQIFKSIQYFIENIALSKPSAVAELCGLTSDAEFYTPKEIEEFNKGKCTVIVRLLYFIAVMLGKSKGNGFKIMPSELWSKPLWRLVCLCVVEPAAVGFNIGDIEVMNNLPKEMEQLLRVFTSGLLPQKALKEMKREFSDCLTGDRDLAGQLNIPLCDKSIDSVRLQQLIAGYDLLNKVGILGDVVSGMVKIKDTVIDHVVKGMTVSEEGRLKVTTISPTAQTTAKALLGLAFHLGYPETKLVKTILDQTKVEGLSKDCSQTLGELFFTSFKSTVAAHLATTAKESMPLLAEHAVKMSHRVSSVMVAVVDTVSRDKDLRKNLGNDVVSAVLGQWKHLSSWWESKSTLDLQSMALLLLTKLVLLDSKFVTNPSHPHFNAVFDMYQKMLVENKTNLAFKTRVLDLLPFFSTLPDPHSKKLKSSLDRLVADNFPLKSTEFTVGSPQYKDYTAALDRILNGLELSGSLMLLELLISIFCREQSHLYEQQMLESLNRFTRRLPADKQKSAIDVAYDIYTQDGAFPSEVRMATVDKVALPMLRLVHKTALIQFYTGHIGELRTVIDNKLVKGAGLENQLVAKICVYKFLEVMYCRLTKDEVFSKSSVINEKFCQAKGVKVDTGKEMTQVIMKNAHEAKGEDVRGETTLLEPRRQFHCAAYNLLIAVLSCTQTDAKFYAVFLFQENEAKGSFVLDNLVDKDKTYEFPSELKAPLARKKQYVSIRNEVKEDRQTGDEDSPTGYSASVHLASQYLADSSLSEDFNQYDFSATSQLSGGSAREKSKLQVVRKSSYTDIDDDSDTKVTVEGDYVELEMDDLNQHECMADLIAVLKHMQRAKIIPVVESGIVPEMPVWMKHLHDKMKSARTHKNIKFFIAKLIVNTSEVFRPYSKYWLLPLCQLILDSSFTSINYFVIDVVVAMLSWHKVAIPQDTIEERAMVKRLAEFLTAFVYSDTRPVYRNNLELLKTLMQVWKDRAEVPYDIIYKQLKQPEAPKKEGSVGIQVLGVVLSCKLPPYGPVAPVDQDKYFSAVVQYCTHDYKTVYAAAAEVVGLIFRYMADKDKVTEGSFHSYVVNLLGTIQQAKPDNFIVSVHRMQRHYPPIADRFMNKLFFLLPNLHGEFRNLCLEMVLSRIDTIENVFMELKGKGLVSFLTHRDEDTQLTSLNIVKAISAKLKPAELLSLMPEIAAFSSNPSVPCRNVMYEVLMWIYDNYREEDNDDGHQIMQQTKESLLKGLGDDDLQCRLLAQNFWSSETRLPTNTADRLASMLEAMYSPVTEQQFLSYATNLILEMTSKSPDYQREMFEHPLEECKFQDYKVKSSWRQRHAVMTPLFASTMSSQTMDMDTTQPEDSVDGQLRATQDVQFSATQDASRAPYNWLTGNSLDTFTDYSTVGSEAPSSLLFTIGTADMAARVNLKPRLKPRQGFGQPRPGTSKNTAPQTSAKKDDDVETSEMSRLKRRFLKDQEQTRIYFAKRYSRLEKMRKEAREEQKARRENQVTMYRRYRKGDLPDIQIKYSYIIAPLQAVAHRDSTIAKLLFGAIFKAIFAKLDEVKTEREVLQTIEEIRNSLNNILSVSTQYFPPFISCMLDILYELRTKIEADIANVGMSAVVSNLQPLGICVLEEQLILREPEERPSKRGRTDGMNISKDTASWIELARLYKSVNEYDVLQGIFSSKIGTKEITKEAVQLESRGDYYRARKLYEEALSTRDWPDGNPSDIEVDMWDDCRMECLDKLTQWQTLEDVAVKGVDNGNIAKVWEDTFYQEHYLPYIIRSKVKLMLQGDESQQTLLKFIDDSMKLPEAKALLESRYCEELAMMYIWQSDYDRARHYVNMAIEKFQQDWSSTDPLMVSSRTSKLQQVQPLVEMQEFLTLISNENNFSSTAQANKLIKNWESRSLHSLLDPVNVWDDLVTNRNVFMDHISSRLNSVKSEDSMDVDKDDDDMQMYVQYLESKVRLKLQMVESCCHSNNHKLALNLLISTKDQCKETGSELVNLEWSHLYTKTHQTKARSADAVWNDELINSIITTVERLGKSDSSDVLKREAGLGRQHYTLRGESLHLLAVGIHSMDNPADLNTKNKDKLIELTGAKKFNKDELIGKLVQHGYDMIKSSLSYEGKSTAACRYGMEEAYLAVATYCNRFLRMQEDEEIKMSQTTLKQFPETTIVCLLNAVKLDSMEARQRIPRLLQLVELYPDTTATFVNKAAEVPSWMFIMWISQMMALLDKPHAAAVHNIVSNLAREYPQAVVYPYQLSSEGYRFGNTAQDKKNIGFVEKLAGLLDEDHLPLVSKFIFALDNLSQPDQIFKDWADDIKIKLAKRKADKKELLTDFYDMYKKLVDVTTDSSRSGRVTVSQTDSLSDSPSLVDKGKYSKKFAERFKKDIESGFGKDGKKLVDMTYSTFAKLASKIQEEMGNEVRGYGAGKRGDGPLLPPKTLKDYCQWLSDFNPNTQGRNLEIPGQYDGLSKPMPEYHIKIAGFDQRVLVMTSIRKPKRITIRGNDEREYNYLVKGGEDLRQDQRIEQLFYMMNQVLDKDPACRQRKLKLKTYQVVPLTPRVGLIEWMNNTMPLKDFLYSNFTEDESKVFKGKQGPTGLHVNWTSKFHKNQALAYHTMYQKCTRTEVTREFQLKESKVPWDLTRRAFHQMSTSPEAFHVLRCKFAVTHATICICQYILGIGDRHLSNFMINLNTGEMVGIDFGHAFGSATQFLPIPELMPIRLTRQIRNIMMPLQVKGLMESTMIHTLRALRNNPDLLLNTMDIFIKEPSVDWMVNANRQLIEMGETESTDDEDFTWYPMEKVNYVKRKLRGENPCYITRDELRLGHSKKACIKSMESVLMGEKRVDTRADLPRHNLSVEQQVAALIDQATDTNIMGRVYVGWEPWM